MQLGILRGEKERQKEIFEEVKAEKTSKIDENYRCEVFVVLEKTLESPLDCKEIKPVHLKGNQP